MAQRTSPINRQVEVLDGAVFSKNLMEMLFVDILR